MRHTICIPLKCFFSVQLEAVFGAEEAEAFGQRYFVAWLEDAEMQIHRIGIRF